MTNLKTTINESLYNVYIQRVSDEHWTIFQFRYKVLAYYSLNNQLSINIHPYLSRLCLLWTGLKAREHVCMCMWVHPYYTYTSLNMAYIVFPNKDII